MLLFSFLACKLAWCSKSVWGERLVIFLPFRCKLLSTTTNGVGGLEVARLVGVGLFVILVGKRA